MKNLLVLTSAGGLTQEARFARLAMALSRLQGVSAAGTELIHHSDRGCQYASSEYVELLRTRNIRISMTENGEPKANAKAERINNTMKNELLHGKRFSGIERVRAAVCEAVRFYNNERPHMSVDMLTPAEASAGKGEISKSYRELAIRAKQEHFAGSGQRVNLPAHAGSQPGNPLPG